MDGYGSPDACAMTCSDRLAAMIIKRILFIIRLFDIRLQRYNKDNKSIIDHYSNDTTT